MRQTTRKQGPKRWPTTGLATLADVAAYLQVSKRTVQRMVRRGAIRKATPAGCYPRFAWAEVRSLEAQ